MNRKQWYEKNDYHGLIVYTVRLIELVYILWLYLCN